MRLKRQESKYMQQFNIDRYFNLLRLNNATLELESAIQQYQRAEAKLGGAVTTISKKVDTINHHIDKVLENAPTKLKVSVNVNDADWQKIQELFTKERQWMVSQMQEHIREVNSIFADEREKVRERYKEYDGCYLGHYAQWFFCLFFIIGFVRTFLVIFLALKDFL